MTENLGILFADNLERENTAVIDLIDPANPLVRSYAELNARANAVASGLLSMAASMYAGRAVPPAQKPPLEGSGARLPSAFLQPK